MIHVVQNAGIVQVLCNTPGSKDSAEFKYTAPSYAVLIFYQYRVGFLCAQICLCKACSRRDAIVYFHQREDCATSMTHTDRSQASMSQCMLHGIIALQNIPQKRDGEREREGDKEGEKIGSLDK